MSETSTPQSLLDAVRRGLAVAPEAAADVAAELETVTCRGGEWLFRQGDAADGLYLLVRGRLQVWIDAPEADGTPPRLIAEVGPGETVGEIGLLSGAGRSAGIRATRDSLLLRMDAAAFDRLALRRPELTRQLAGGIAMRLRDRTAGGPAARRSLKTVALLPLDDGPVVRDLAERLSIALAGRGTVRVLTRHSVEEVGLVLPRHPGEPIAPAVVDWFAAHEDTNRFVLYVADSGATPWSDAALRHADLVLLVGEAGRTPRRREWEAALLDAPRGPVARQALVLTHPGSPLGLLGTGAWLQDRNLDFHLHLREHVAADFARLVRVIDGSALGLVLGGGAARGFAHLGVYQAMSEAGIAVDWVGGSSIGSVMGAAIALDLSPDEAIARARAAFVDGKPFGDMTLPVISLLRGQRMERLIGEYLGGMIEDLPIPFFCLTSALGSGESRLHDRGSLPAALRASVSIPGVFPPAVVGGQLAIDGGILDNLPVDRMRGRPVGRVVAVDVTGRQTYEVDYEAVPSPWALLAGRYLPFARRYRVPGFLAVMLKAAEIGTMRAAREAGLRADLLIRPDVNRFSLTDVKPFAAIVAAGYEGGRSALAALQKI
ncbi:MAG: patatin-like phospholipase domain-containing protein [Steroidobacteraceae bacterium]|nr:patatin-like phospholipase domain-containing protein [Steroidobacteraceae bacterium]